MSAQSSVPYSQVGQRYVDTAGMLGEIVRNAADRTSWSDELHLAAAGSPESLHLDRGRANVLRGLALPRNITVLEVGAEAGSLTRFLGERVTAVDALETDPGLASAAASRTGDLANVTLHHKPVEDLADARNYDVAIVSGRATQCPGRTVLRAVRRRLRRGGVLCLIGANSLGLAPFSPPGREPRAGNSRAGWEAAATNAGFSLIRTLGCLPDHRTTRVLFADEMEREQPRLLADLPGLHSAERERWSQLIDARLASACAPGFVILASDSPSQGGHHLDLWPDGQLATYFNTDRAAAWCTSGQILGNREHAEVVRTPMWPALQPRGQVAVRSYREPVYQASTMVQTLLAEPWRTPQLLTAWSERLSAEAGALGPALWDFVPGNTVVDDRRGGALHPIDLEWEVADAPVETVVHRGILLLADRLAAEGWAGAANGSTVEDLAMWLGALLELPCEFVDSAVEREAWFQAVRVAATSTGPGFDREHDAMRLAWRHRLADIVRDPDQCVPTHMPSDELDHAVNAAMSRVNRVIADGDTMFRGSSRHYFLAGAGALRACLHGLSAAGQVHPQRILDFGCGYGRVLRTFRAAFPAADLFACDVDSDGVDYCEQAFGATTFAISTDLCDPKPVADIDLLWSGSVLTHLDAENWRDLLRYVTQALAVGGVAVLTTHGRRAAWLMGHTGAVRYGLTETAGRQVLRDYRNYGFGYADYPGQDGYGISLSSIGWIANLIAGADGIRLVGYTEAGWDNHQDILVLAKDADNTLTRNG